MIRDRAILIYYGSSCNYACRWILDGSIHTWRETDTLLAALPEGDDGITPAEEDALGTARERAAGDGASDSYLSAGLKEELEDDELIAAEAAGSNPLTCFDLVHAS